VLKVPFSVPLAFVVAICDLIPMIGATLGAVIGVLVALFATDLWPTTVLVAVFFVVYQQVENYFIAPRILRSTVNLSAAAVLLAGLIGATALGLVGALMAIPVAAALKVLLTEQLEAREAAEAHARTSEIAADEAAELPAEEAAELPAEEATGEAEEASRSQTAATGSGGPHRPR
jgi:predicted PurR-regulated permease PerM